MRLKIVLGLFVVAAMTVAGGCTATSPQAVSPQETNAHAEATPEQVATPSPSPERPTEDELSRDYSALIEAAGFDEKLHYCHDRDFHLMGAVYAFTEYQVQLRIHDMTVHKVISEDTWRGRLITPKGVEIILSAIEAHPDWEHNDLYLSMMERWIEGDFSQAVGDYNAIAELLGDHLAQAKRAKAPEEEAEYLGRGSC